MTFRSKRKRQVWLRVRADGAGVVSVTGEFTGWSAEGVRLKRGTEGLWRARLSLPPGEYQYRLLVDGQWRDHEEAERRVPNPYGSQNAVLTVPA